MNKLHIIVLLLILFTTQNSAESIKHIDIASLMTINKDIKNSLIINSDYGTHRKGIGIENITLAYIDFPLIKYFFDSVQLSEELGLSLRLGYKHYNKDFGLPGTSDIFESHVKFLYSIGEKNNLYLKYPGISGRRRHTFSIGYNGFLTTDTTSQVVGQIDYSYIMKSHAIVFNYMNDTIFVYPSDKYRTAAVKLSYYREVKNNLLGVSAGFSIWAGERKFDLEKIWNNGNVDIPNEVNRGETVTLYNGKEYATNIIYASISINNISISIGYDSEKYKKIIHNNIHYLIDDGNLPSIDREDRIFLEFKIGLQDKLF